MIPRPLRPPPPRTLPWVGEDPKRYVVNAHGAFVAQPVGSTEYSTGLHLWAHPAGDAESAHGLYAFCARIGEDGAIAWVQMQSSYVLHHERAAELFPIMLDIARAWIDRDPGHFVCHVIDQARKELHQRWGDRRELDDSQKHLSKLLSDPGKPRTEFKIDSDGERRELPATPEEKAARRALWERNLVRTTARIAAFHARHDARILQLEQAKERLVAFIRSKDHSGEAAHALFPLPALDRASDVVHVRDQITVDS